MTERRIIVVGGGPAGLMAAGQAAGLGAETVLLEKKERPGRNPKTGEEIPISARRVVTFRPGQKLKQRVEAYAGRE